MEQMFQTLNDFILRPFGIPNTNRVDYENKYNKIKTTRGIDVKSILQIDDDYFIHVKILSETDKYSKYDVIIQFFPSSENSKTSISLENYYIKFFSNSPSFVYKYAALYKQKGYLIEVLSDKLDKEALDKLPEKTNSQMLLSYDKSIYFACRYLLDTKFSHLMKLSLTTKKTKNLEKFLRGIDTFENIIVTRQVNNIENSIKKSIRNTKEKVKDNSQKTYKKLGKKTALPKNQKVNAKSKIYRKSKILSSKKTKGL